MILQGKCFDDLLKLIHELTGVTIDPSRGSMVEGRLRKRLIALGLKTYEEYMKTVQDDMIERASFIDLITTHETYFYRTPRIWEYIEQKLLPEWHQKNPGVIFNAWSAAASSGEEARTLGMICQLFREKHPNFSYQILGTDISKGMVQRCEDGPYTGRSIESLKRSRPELFQKYMKKVHGDFYDVTAEIKSRLKFRQHNLFTRLPSVERFDLVLIRNVLIYFTGPDQEKVISLISPNLKSDSVVIIGESESLTHIKTNLQALEPLIYHQRKAS